MKQLFILLVQAFSFFGVLVCGITSILLFFGPVAIALDQRSATYLFIYLLAIPLMMLFLRLAGLLLSYSLNTKME